MAGNELATISECVSQIGTDKTALATNLTTKGVTSSDTESMASLAAKILAIPSGGSGGAIIKKGTFVPGSNIQEDYEINHTVGEVPDFVVIDIATSAAATKKFFLELWDGKNVVRDYVGTTGTFGSVSITQSKESPQKITINSTKIIIHATSDMQLNSGTTYAWMAIKFPN